MTHYTFTGYKRRSEAVFTCSVCGKPRRRRVFTVEHTVNPFNKNADGSVRTSAEVAACAAAEAKRRRDEFMTQPLCAACETALPYLSLKALNTQRHTAFAAIEAAK